MKIKNFKKKQKLQKGEKCLPLATDEVTSSDEEVVEEVRESRKKRRKSQSSKMVKKRLYSNKAVYHIF